MPQKAQRPNKDKHVLVGHVPCTSKHKLNETPNGLPTLQAGGP